jgi:hypothetical protein
MPHIAPQKIVDWQQNSVGESDYLLFTRSLDASKVQIAALLTPF